MTILSLTPHQKFNRSKQYDMKPFTNIETSSPFYSIPNCKEPYHKVVKKNTDIKGILCPMFRDEEGFLTEWIAFYKLMGFDHIMLFDDGSTDKSLQELQPWIDIGFVSVKSNWTLHTVGLDPQLHSNHFHAVMAAKSMLETECKLQAIEWGYHYFVSLDLDEYLFPKNSLDTVVDELHRVMTTTGAISLCLDKHAYPATLHILEPVDLLTIEAYQSRVNAPNRMNSFVLTARKCAYPLYLRPNFTHTTQRYVAECCRFHGCEKVDKKANSTFCSDHQGEKNLVQNPVRWANPFQMNHYARSLEKYMLKQKTWHTTAAGRTESSARSGYTLKKYFERSFGWTYDPSALRYSCQLREIIANVTKESVFYRHGDFWYRNPEFGREIHDISKRGSHGGSIQESPVFSPYHYLRFQQQTQFNQ